MKKAIFPGSFDPFTIGHADIVDRGLRLFDEIVIAIGVNNAKTTPADIVTRLKTIRELYKAEPRIAVETYGGLTVDFANSINADAILRGVRSIKDYEYERDMADINQRIGGVETVLLFSRPELAAVSSSMTRELRHFGKDITPFLPGKH